MARDNVSQTSLNPYHITNRCLNREQFFTPLEDTWKILVHHLSLMHYKYDLRIHSFVLMPNHYHLLATSQTFPIGYVMRDFSSSTSQHMNELSGRINQNWGSRYFKCELNNHEYFINCYKYIYQNPVRAGLARTVLDWPYSTLSGLMGYTKLELPLEPDTILFNPEFDEKELDWLNTKIGIDDIDSVREALKRRSFKLPHQNHGKVHPLEHSRI